MFALSNITQVQLVIYYFLHMERSEKGPNRGIILSVTAPSLWLGGDMQSKLIPNHNQVILNRIPIIQNPNSVSGLQRAALQEVIERFRITKWSESKLSRQVPAIFKIPLASTSAIPHGDMAEWKSPLGWKHRHWSTPHISAQQRVDGLESTDSPPEIFNFYFAIDSDFYKKNMNDRKANYQDRCQQSLRFRLPQHLQFLMEIWQNGSLLSDENIATEALLIFQHSRGLMDSTDPMPEIFNFYLVIRLPLNIHWSEVSSFNKFSNYRFIRLQLKQYIYIRHLHMVVATKHKLLKELLVLETDGAIIRGFKEHLKVMLDWYFPLNETHKMATLLDPKFKKIATKMLSEQDLKEALNNLNSMVDDLPLARPAPTGVKDPTQPPAKKRKTHNDNSSEFFVDLFENEEAVTKEIDSYWSSTDSDDNISPFWKNKAELYPNLSLVARSI